MYLGVRGYNLKVGECNLGVREFIWELGYNLGVRGCI